MKKEAVKKEAVKKAVSKCANDCLGNRPREIQATAVASALPGYPTRLRSSSYYECSHCGAQWIQPSQMVVGHGATLLTSREPVTGKLKREAYDPAKHGDAEAPGPET